MSILVHIESTPALFLSDDGQTTTEGRAWQAAIRRVTGHEQMASILKPQLVRPSLVLQVSSSALSSGLLELDDLVGKDATAWQGLGLVFDAYDTIMEGTIVAQQGTQGQDLALLTIEPTLPNPSVVFEQETATNLASLATGVIMDNNVAVEFNFADWLAASKRQGTADIAEPRPILDLIAQMAFEDFRDLAVLSGELRAIQRAPADATTIPVFNQLAPGWRIRQDPLSEVVTRLLLCFEDEIRIYDDTAGQTALGVREQTVTPLFIPKTQADEWAARYLHRYSEVPIYLECRLPGAWRIGDQFKVNIQDPLLAHREHLDGDRFQVRRAAWLPRSNQTAVLARVVVDDPASVTAMDPSSTVDKLTPLTDDPDQAVDKLEAPTNLRRNDAKTDEDTIVVDWDSTHTEGQVLFELEYREVIE